MEDTVVAADGACETEMESELGAIVVGFQVGLHVGSAESSRDTKPVGFCEGRAGGFCQGSELGEMMFL